MIVANPKHGGAIPKVSVCLASYNGQDFIREQIRSILMQIGAGDELIICDDASTDRTVSIIQSFNDPRVTLLPNSGNVGVAAAFSKTLEKASGDITFLADQDDVWEVNKVKRVLELFDSGSVNLVVHDAYVTDKTSGLVRGRLTDNRGRHPGLVKNLIFNSFTGCCMAFDRRVRDAVIPINPSIGIYHDAWIGALCQINGFKVLFVSDPLIKFMRHDNNTSQLGFTGLRNAVCGRAVFYWALLKRILIRISGV